MQDVDPKATKFSGECVGQVNFPAVAASPNGTADVLNRIQSATVYAQRSNLMSIPTDCP